MHTFIHRHVFLGMMAFFVMALFVFGCSEDKGLPVIPPGQQYTGSITAQKTNGKITRIDGNLPDFKVENYQDACNALMQMESLVMDLKGYVEQMKPAETPVNPNLPVDLPKVMPKAAQ
jgi:hypothetical protein